MRPMVRRSLAIAFAVGGLVVQWGGPSAASTFTGAATGAAAALDSGCSVNWYVQAGVGAVVFKADGSVIAPRASTAVNLIGAACGTQTGRADIGATWQTNNASQEVLCSGQGVYTYLRHTSVLNLRASEACTWYNFQTGLRVPFIGQLSGYISPGALGHAVEVLQLT
jgi:hypothetical protein